MADNTLLHYTDSVDLVSWFTFSNDGQLTSEVTIGSLEQLKTQIGQSKVHVLIPGHHVLLSDVEVPSRKEKQIRAAIPYALEDRLAENISAVFFALGSIGKQGPVPVASVSKAYLRSVLDTLNEAGIQPMTIVPDMLCVDESAGDWCVLQANDRCLVRINENHAFSCPAKDLIVYIRAALENSDVDTPNTLTNIAPAVSDELRLLLETHGITMQHSPDITQSAKMFAKAVSDGVPINLMQGEFAAKSAWSLDFDWRRWRVPAAVAAAIMITQIGYTAYQNISLERQSQALHNEMVALYKQVFPTAKKIVDPRAQMESKLKLLARDNSGSSSEFLSLLENTAPHVQQMDNIDLTRLTYKDGALSYNFTIDSMTSVESLQAKLSADRSTAVSLESAKSERGAITAIIKVSDK